MTISRTSSDSTTTARAAVETALTLDRTSTRLIAATQARMVAAQLDFDAGIGGPDVAVVLSATNELQVAIGASVFATEYQNSCRTILAMSLDELSGSGPRPDDQTQATGDRQVPASAAAIVVAEATAIAAAAEARLAAETYAGTVRAASTAHEAVLLAAATVARAAEDERRARALADTLAADEVAAAAVTAARDVQRRADAVASAVSAAAAVAVSALPPPRDAGAVRTAGQLAALVHSTAASTAHETAVAAAIVADAVAHAAATVAVATAAKTAAIEQDVRAAARAVQSRAEVIAAELAEASVRARQASPAATSELPVLGSTTDSWTR